MLLELKNIKKYYPVKKGLLNQGESFVKAVDDVSLYIKKGKNLSLVGESGCGKTTLARIILQLIKCEHGRIFFNNENITGLSFKGMKRFRASMQMVFQDPYSSLDPRFTVWNILNEALAMKGSIFRTRKQKQGKMKLALNSVNLSEKILERYPHEFSGGERQRIAIARALITNPQLLILDEAVSSLDVIIQKQLIDLFLELQKKLGLTYLFISHNLKIAKKISQKIAVMYKGKIVELGTSTEIFNDPLHAYTRQLLSAAVEYKSLHQDINCAGDLVDAGAGHLVRK